jgi:hypothetical protein
VFSSMYCASHTPGLHLASMGQRLVLNAIPHSLCLPSMWLGWVVMHLLLCQSPWLLLFHQLNTS